MKTKGISLIVLVITIIVLAILATTVIVILSETNIIGLANSAVNKNKIANIKEAANLAYSDLFLQYNKDTSLITEDAIKQKMIESGIDASDLENITILIGENGISIGEKQVGTNSGTITNSEKTIVNYTISGNSIQDGELTEGSSVDFKSVGDKSKNLFNIKEIVAGKQVSSLNANTAYYEIQLKPNTSYTLTTNCYAAGSASMFLTAPNVGPNTNQNGVYNGATYITQTTDETGILWIWVRINGGLNILDSSQFDDGTYWAQLEEGSVATEYEPYWDGYKIPITVTNAEGTNTYNIYLDEPLRKIGEHEDIIDFESKQIIRKVVAKNMNEVTTWNMFADTTNTKRFYSSEIADSQDNMGLCNRFEHNYDAITSDTSEEVGFSVFSNQYRFRTTHQTVEAWENYIASNDVIAYTVLTTPSVNSIELPEIYATEGTTTITIDTEVSPSKVEFVYPYN